MPKDDKRIQAPLDKAHRDALIDVAAEYEKMTDRRVGDGNVAALLLKRVLDNPDLVHMLLYGSVDDAKFSKEEIDLLFKIISARNGLEVPPDSGNLSAPKGLGYRDRAA